MILRFPWALIVLACLLSSVEGKPNIIYINVDDLGVMDVGFQSPRYNTPNINQLALEGMTFTEAYAPAANCAPSRACCFSGQNSPRHGVYTVGNSDRGRSRFRKLIPIANTQHLADQNLTLAEALQAGGYRTIHLGKWHLGDDPTTQGFDVNVGGDTSGGPSGGYFAPFGRGPMQKYNAEFPEGTHRTDLFADKAVAFIQQNRDRPFFVNMAYYSIHTRLEPVPEFIEKYRGQKDVNATYASMIEKMDQSIGRILNTLDDLALSENTLVLFSSDNGGICAISPQTPYRAGKGSYYEGGIRVPLVIRWPDQVAAGSRCEVPVTGMDYYPTFLKAAGLAIPANKQLDGSSLLPLMTQEGAFPERALFWHFPVYLQAYAGAKDDSRDPLFRTRPGSVMRFGKWKLHEYFEDGQLELYDLNADSGERTDLAKSMPQKTQQLHAMLETWRAETKAPVPTELNPTYDQAADHDARTSRAIR